MADRFDKFSEAAASALSHAHEEARALGHDHMDTGHLLLGLIAARDPAVESLLRTAGVEADAIRRQVEITVAQSADLPEGTRGLLPEGRRSIQLAVDPARRASSLQIEAEYLLLGILQQPECVGARALVASGVDVAELESTLSEQIAEDELDGAASGAPKAIELARRELDRRGRTPLIPDRAARDLVVQRLEEASRAIDATNIGYAKLIGSELLAPEIEFVTDAIATGAHTFPGFLERVGEVRHARRTLEHLAELYRRADDTRLAEATSRAAAALQVASPLF